MQKITLFLALVASLLITACDVASDSTQEDISDAEIQVLADELIATEAFAKMASNYRSYHALLLSGTQAGAQLLSGEELSIMRVLPRNDREQFLLDKGYSDAEAICLAYEEMETARKQTLQKLNFALLELNNADKEVFTENLNKTSEPLVNLSPQEALTAADYGSSLK